MVQTSEAATDDGFRLVLLLRLAPVLPLPFDSYWRAAAGPRAKPRSAESSASFGAARGLSVMSGSREELQ